MTSHVADEPGREVFAPATTSDVQDLVEIERDSPVPWTQNALLDELLQDPPRVFVLRSEERTVAFVITRIQGPDLDIVNLAVSADRRRLGYGRTLVRSVLGRVVHEGVRRVFLEVREGNEAARALYRGLGFKETQRRRGFYRQPTEDAILMSLEIEP